MARFLNGRTQTRGRGAKDLRRNEGVKRNAVWAALSTAEKVASLRGRRGESRRQMKTLVPTLQAQP